MVETLRLLLQNKLGEEESRITDSHFELGFTRI
jgi:hypothetical protein